MSDFSHCWLPLLGVIVGILIGRLPPYLRVFYTRVKATLAAKAAAAEKAAKADLDALEARVVVLEQTTIRKAETISF